MNIYLNSQYVDAGIIVDYFDINDNLSHEITLNDTNGWNPASGTLIISLFNANLNSTITINNLTNSSTWFLTSETNSYILTFTYTDNDNRQTRFVRSISVVALPVAMLSLIGEANYKWLFNIPYIDQGYNLTDPLNPNPIASVINNVNVNHIGISTYTYTYTDSSNRTISATRSVDILDATYTPTLNISNSIQDLVAGECTFLDFVAMVTSVNVTISGYTKLTDAKSAYQRNYLSITSNGMSIDHITNTLGSHLVVFTLTDIWGNQVTHSKVVVIISTNQQDIRFDHTATPKNSVFPYGIGTKPTYSRDASIVGNSEVFDVDNIVQNIYNILFTTKGERIYNPLFGSTLNTVPFALMSTMSDTEILSTIKKDVENYETRAIVNLDQSQVIRNASTRSVDIDIVVQVPAGQFKKIGITYNG